MAHMQIADLIRYNHTVRKLYLDAMAKLPWQQVIEFRGLSFDSMRDVFLHLTLVEDRWINYTIPGRFADWRDPDFAGFQDSVSLCRYVETVQRNTEAYLSRLSQTELKRQIAVPWGKPDTRLDVESCLTHMVLEDMINYGELSAAFWQMGLEAPYLGFWRFTSEKR